MIDIFLLKLFLSFAIGGSLVTIGTVASEKFGTKIGGVISGMPSTSLVALFFIGLSQSAFIASKSTAIIPIVVGVDALFVAVYILLSKINFYFAVSCSLLLWLVSSLILILIKFDNFAYSLAGFIIFLAISYYAIDKKSGIKSESRRNTKYSFQILLFRGMLSGAIIAISVLLAKLGGPILGGIFASFPAAYLSTIIITNFAHGKAFSAAVMKTLMVSGSVNVVAYAISVRYSYPYFGLLYGTLISYFVSLVSAYFVYLFAIKKMS